MESYKVITRNKDIGSNKNLLDKGLIPGIIYGKGTEPKKIAFDNKALQKLMHSELTGHIELISGQRSSIASLASNIL